MYKWHALRGQVAVSADMGKHDGTSALLCNRSAATMAWLESISWPTSCKAILDADPSSRSGSYRVQPAASPTSLVVYCDMDTAGGGWTLCGKYGRSEADTDQTTNSLTTSPILTCLSLPYSGTIVMLLLWQITHH